MAMRRIVIAVALLLSIDCNAFTTTPSSRKNVCHRQSSSSPFPLGMSSTVESVKINEKKERYVPKWKKKATLAEDTGTADISSAEKGLAGAVPIVFQQGTGDDASLIRTSAMPGQPLKLVASQAGQYIKYGCGKGECGTCESLCNGKYLRPCVDVVPTDLDLDAETEEFPELVIRVKGTRAKVVSSGKFFSAKSFVMGFWNNLLGMVGFVRDRRKARKNWQERMSKEDEIKRLTEEKKRKRAEEAANTSSKVTM